MTTTFNYSSRLRPGRRQDAENKNLFLFSPLTLLALVALLFTFFLMASRESGYLKDYVKANEDRKAAGVKESKPDPAVMYREIVTSADAIRSVLQ